MTGFDVEHQIQLPFTSQHWDNNTLIFFKQQKERTEATHGEYIKHHSEKHASPRGSERVKTWSSHKQNGSNSNENWFS